MEILRLLPEHLDGVLALCVAENWPSLPEDPARAMRILTAPGVTTVVAVNEGEVVGFAQLLSDGELQSFLASIAVDARFVVVVSAARSSRRRCDSAVERGSTS